MTGADEGRALRTRQRGERGVVIVIVAIMLVVLIGFGSLVFDMGQLFTVRGELQNTTDSASLAGALMLDQTQAGLERARAQVRQYAQEHKSDFTTSNIADEDIIFGIWDEAQGTFTALGSDPDPKLVNAVQVRDRRAESSDNPVTLRLAPVIGHTRANVSAQAVAVGGGPATECGAPIAVPECTLEEPVDSGDCEHCLVFSPDSGSDQNAAWMDVENRGNVGASQLGQQFREACPEIDPVTDECAAPNQCLNEAHVGDERGVNTGDFMGTGAQGPCLSIADRLTRDGLIPTGKPFTVRVPVFGGTDCSGPITGGDREIVGYATFEIFGVRCGKSHDAIIAPGSPDCGGVTSNEKFIAGRLRCDVESDRPPGGGFFGTDTRRSRLVQ